MSLDQSHTSSLARFGCGTSNLEQGSPSFARPSLGGLLVGCVSRPQPFGSLAFFVLDLFSFLVGFVVG